MPTQDTIFPRRSVVAATLFVLTALLFLTSGCAGTSGGFTLDARVTRDFQTGVIQSDYQYYYQGRDDMPYAIIGIDRGYTVPSPYWIAFEPQPEQLRNMSGNVYGKHVYDPYGAFVRDADGAIVGVWFSNLRFHSVNVDQQAKTVAILFPNPENDNSAGASLNVPSW